MTDLTETQPALADDMPPVKAKKSATSKSPRPKSPKRPNTSINLGIHPTTRLPLLEEQTGPEGLRTRCGTCAHHYLAYTGRYRGLNIETYACDLVTPPSLEADPTWPACVKHQPREP